MKISAASVFVLLLVFFVGLFSGFASGEDKKGAPIYTNQDIEKYKKTSDANTPIAKADRTTDKKEKAQKIVEEREKEYWCKSATYHKRKIEKIKDDIAETEKEIPVENERPLSSKNKKAVQKRLNALNKNLKYAEKDLNGLEAEAHRKSIPPGWLRCQFE
ncbi:MAG: hypothetical protein EPN94_10195 [Nitrospirae bacterium]|nr:MAG: hypothetical protein EPN94_10195 [Nitrospirota bacterium]